MLKNLQKRRKQAEEEKRDFSLGETTAAVAEAQRTSTRTLRKRGAKDQSNDGTNGLSDSKKPSGTWSSWVFWPGGA